MSAVSDFNLGGGRFGDRLFRRFDDLHRFLFFVHLCMHAGVIRNDNWENDDGRLESSQLYDCDRAEKCFAEHLEVGIRVCLIHDDEISEDCVRYNFARNWIVHNDYRFKNFYALLWAESQRLLRTIIPLRPAVCNSRCGGIGFCRELAEREEYFKLSFALHDEFHPAEHWYNVSIENARNDAVQRERLLEIARAIGDHLTIAHLMGNPQGSDNNDDRGGYASEGGVAVRDRREELDMVED